MNPAVATYFELRTEPHKPRKHAVLLVVLLSSVAFFFVSVSAVLAAAFFYYQTTTAEFAPLGEEISVKGAGITTIYDRNGEHLGAIANPNSAIVAPIGLAEISPYMVSATVSTEDNNYWEHTGFDLQGLGRAAWTNYNSDDVTTGGSTITQQLVKTVYFTTECTEVDGVSQCVAPRTVDRKLKELVLAVETEGRYSKEQILVWYLNSISYSGRYVGVESAAQGYFEKSSSELTLAEAALLAGIPAAPTQYHPRLNCVRDSTSEACLVDDAGRTTVAGAAKERQEYVLDLMAEHGHITQAEADAAKAEQVLVAPGIIENQAASFIDSQVEPRLVRMCEGGLLPKNPDAKDCEESVHNAGYKVTTTLDWQMTQQAQRMMNDFIVAGLKAGCDCHNASIVTIEPASGQVIVYVPSIDSSWVSDPRVAGNIDQAADVHQPGSSFKPAVYLTWFESLNKTPMSSFWDTSPMVIAQPGQAAVTITNPGRVASQGLITARAALGGSQNVPAFRAAAESGVDNVIAMAKALGITTLEQGFDPTFRDHESVYYGPAIATGGANIRAIDMAYMNATISNMGTMVGVPTYASTLEVKDALSVEGARGDRLERAWNQRAAFLHGHLRLPGTRSLDPVTVLRVESAAGDVLYQHGDDLVKLQVVNAGSVWMLHSIMSDCTARFIIWGCGSSNSDLSLDFFMDGVKIPGGVKTGTQQGVTARDTLETWMTGYSRYAATALWVGNANKLNVRDGPEANYAAANTTVRLFKTWMGAYHADLRDLGMFEVPAGFDELQPENVKYGPFQSATTERGRGGGCNSFVSGWQRTDVDYQGGDCKGRQCFELPSYAPSGAYAIAASRGVPACGASGTQPNTISAPPTVPPAARPQTASPGNTPNAPAQQQPTVKPQPPPTQPPPTPVPATPPPAQPTQAPATPAATTQNQQQSGGPGNGNGNNGNGNGNGND